MHDGQRVSHKLIIGGRSDTGALSGAPALPLSRPDQESDSAGREQCEASWLGGWRNLCHAKTEDPRLGSWIVGEVIVSVHIIHGEEIVSSASDSTIWTVRTRPFRFVPLAYIAVLVERAIGTWRGCKRAN